MFKIYFDSSVKNQWLTLAGFAAEEDQWRHFDGTWKEILRDRGGVPYMHMTEAMNFGGPFEKRKGWDENKIDSLVGGLVSLLMEMPKNRFHAFRCTVERPAYARWRGRLGYPEAERHCARWAFVKAYTWHGSSRDNLLLDKADVIYDRGESFLKHIYKYWQNRKKLALTQPWWNLINNVVTADWRDTPALQAADMLAWSANTLCSVPKNNFEHQNCSLVLNAPAAWLKILDESTLSDIYRKRAIHDTSLLLLPQGFIPKPH